MDKSLKWARLHAGLTQEDMAHLLGYRSKSGYNMIETGRNHPPLSIAMKIAEVLKRPVHELFDMSYYGIDTVYPTNGFDIREQLGSGGITIGISSRDENNTMRVTPISSGWVMGDLLVVGLDAASI